MTYNKVITDYKEMVVLPNMRNHVLFKLTGKYAIPAVSVCHLDIENNKFVFDSIDWSDTVSHTIASFKDWLKEYNISPADLIYTYHTERQDVDLLRIWWDISFKDPRMNTIYALCNGEY